MNAGKIDQAEFKHLFDRLDDRIEKARAAINNGNLNQYNGLIKSTEALTNNAKHFIKKNNQDNTNESFGQPDDPEATSTENAGEKNNSSRRNRK